MNTQAEHCYWMVIPALVQSVIAQYLQRTYKFKITPYRSFFPNMSDHAQGVSQSTYERRILVINPVKMQMSIFTYTTERYNQVLRVLPPSRKIDFEELKSHLALIMERHTTQYTEVDGVKYTWIKERNVVEIQYPRDSEILYISEAQASQLMDLITEVSKYYVEFLDERGQATSIPLHYIDPDHDKMMIGCQEVPIKETMDVVMKLFQGNKTKGKSLGRSGTIR